MDYSSDELAGIVDLFGALARSSLHRAVSELGFKTGSAVDDDEVESAIDEAIHEYALVAVTLEDETLLAPGPTAFPELPGGADDLPHILDHERREVPREAIETTVRRRLASSAAELEDVERAGELIDITYDAEAWAGLDLEDVRTRLEAIIEEAGETDG